MMNVTDTENRSDDNRGKRLAVLVFLAFAIAGCALALTRMEHISKDAVLFDGICRELLANTTTGRQALVGSAWVPPLPVLFRLPVAALVGTGPVPVASIIVGMIAAFCVLVILNRALRGWDVPAGVRWIALAVFACNPHFVSAACDGSSALESILFLLLSAWGFVQWVATRGVRYLVYMAFGVALLAVSGMELSALVAMVVVLMLVDQLFCGFDTQRNDAAFILGMLPLVYVLGLWFLMNWLVLGDAFYFVRSLPGFSGSVSNSATQAGILPMDWCMLSAPGVLMLVSLVRRDRAGAWMAILAATPLVAAVFMESYGLLWSRAPVLLAATPFALFCAAMIPDRTTGSRTARSLLVMAVPVLLTGVGIAQTLRNDGTGDTTLEQVLAERRTILAGVEKHVLSRSKYSKVFVCGYEGFMLLDRKASPVFVHSMDFNFNKATQDYRGHSLYLLVNRPVKKSGMDSIHWLYRDIYRFGAIDTLYEGDWGDWRLFEILTPPR